MADHPTATWKCRAEPDPGTNGRATVCTRGRVIGGSCSIDALVYVRGQPRTTTIGRSSAIAVVVGRWLAALPRGGALGGRSHRGARQAQALFTSKTDRSPLCTTVIEAVNNELQVHGHEIEIGGLRVLDASVMPVVTLTNTNAPTIMIAEKATTMIKTSAQKRLAA